MILAPLQSCVLSQMRWKWFGSSLAAAGVCPFEMKSSAVPFVI